MNTQTIDLDISKRGTFGNVIKIGQGDVGGTTIVANIYDNGVALTLTGYSATFIVRLPDKIHYVRDAGCTVSGNQITYVVDEEHVAAVAGYTDEAYFALTKSSKTYSTERFALDIERCGYDGASPASSWDTSVDKLIAEGQAAVDAANTAASTAQKAASSANSAAGTANTAATAAKTATSDAKTATDAANKAASSANSAASSANTAATKATDAADAASTAADSASAAAGTATTAAGKADTATSNAKTATDAANKAATAANDAAASASAAVEDAVNEKVPAAVAEQVPSAVAAEVAKYQEVTFSVNAETGIVTATYKPSESEA